MRKRKTLADQAHAPQSPAQPQRTPKPMIIDQLLTITEAAAVLGLGRTKVYDLMKNNQLPYVEIPGVGESTKRISALTLNAWIKERETLRHVS